MTDAVADAPPAPPVAPLTLGERRPDLGTGTTDARTPARLYLTSDLRAATGLSRTHMDFYLREGLVRPTARTEGGYLLFDEAELATLRTLLDWRRDGLGLRQIRARLGR